MYLHPRSHHCLLIFIKNCNTLVLIAWIISKNSWGGGWGVSQNVYFGIPILKGVRAFGELMFPPHPFQYGSYNFTDLLSPDVIFQLSWFYCNNKNSVSGDKSRLCYLKNRFHIKFASMDIKFCSNLVGS